MLDDSQGFSAIIDIIFYAASGFCYGQNNDQKNQEFVTSHLMLEKSKIIIILMHLSVGEEEWSGCGEKHEDCWSSLFQHRLACRTDCTHKTRIKA